MIKMTRDDLINKMAVEYTDCNLGDRDTLMGFAEEMYEGYSSAELIKIYAEINDDNVHIIDDEVEERYPITKHEVVTALTDITTSTYHMDTDYYYQLVYRGYAALTDEQLIEEYELGAGINITLITNDTAVDKSIWYTDREDLIGQLTADFTSKYEIGNLAEEHAIYLGYSAMTDDKLIELYEANSTVKVVLTDNEGRVIFDGSTMSSDEELAEIEAEPTAEEYDTVQKSLDVAIAVVEDPGAFLEDDIMDRLTEAADVLKGISIYIESRKQEVINNA